DHSISFTTDPREIAGAGLVILSTPISQFGEAVKSVSPYLGGDTIVTDVGSAKQRSIETIRSALPQGAEYVPAHPLNGNAGSGPLTASDTMFDGKPVIVIPDQASKPAEASVKGFWESLGAKVTSMDAEKHDKLLGTMSHLEHAIMFSVMNTSFIQ